MQVTAAGGKCSNEMGKGQIPLTEQQYPSSIITTLGGENGVLVEINFPLPIFPNSFKHPTILPTVLLQYKESFSETGRNTY